MRRSTRPSSTRCSRRRERGSSMYVRVSLGTSSRVAVPRLMIGCILMKEREREREREEREEEEREGMDLMKGIHSARIMHRCIDFIEEWVSCRPVVHRYHLPSLPSPPPLLPSPLPSLPLPSPPLLSSSS